MGGGGGVGWLGRGRWGASVSGVVGVFVVVGGGEWIIEAQLVCLAAWGWVFVEGCRGTRSARMVGHSSSKTK